MGVGVGCVYSAGWPTRSPQIFKIPFVASLPPGIAQKKRKSSFGASEKAKPKIEVEKASGRALVVFCVLRKEEKRGIRRIWMQHTAETQKERIKRLFQKIMELGQRGHPPA